MTKTIWWIRRDLRLADNQALSQAMELGDQVLPVFVLDPHLLDSSYAGTRRIAFLMEGLRVLDADLRERGSRLIVREGEPGHVMRQLCDEQSVMAVVGEKDVSPYAVARDKRVERLLDSVAVEFVEGVAIRPVGSVRKEDGSPYTVFTPYSRRWKENARLDSADLLPAPTRIDTPSDIESASILQVNGEPPDDDVELDEAWQAGESAASSRLSAFTDGASPLIHGYRANRNRPDLDATSSLSPYLRFGMISARAAAVAAYEAMADAPSDAARGGAETWLNELIWRDFYINILVEFPHVRSGSFRPEYDAISWANDESDFEAWRLGRTGYPFVDAAMRQLLAIGWMHNRTRMVVASFLVKDLLIDWRWGERWFMQQLLDGDPANNNGGWQWTAGTGTDAAPYFRIFNPISQGKKFDPDGVFVRKWVPELADVPTSAIHEPWKLTPLEQTAAGCLLGEDYPQPIVDHGWARKRTLDAYKIARDFSDA
jgi:deoxyribodipyrimidine photo-lyase